MVKIAAATLAANVLLKGLGITQFFAHKKGYCELPQKWCWN